METPLVEYVRTNLPRVTALFFGWILGILFFSSTNEFFKDLISSGYIRFSLYFIALLIWTLYWEHYRSCSRRTKKNKIGIVISIYSENVREEKILKADFIARLNERIRSENLTSIVQVNVLKNHIAEKIQSHEDVLKLNKRIKAHFYVYGNLRLRNTNTYFLNINNVVFHVPLNKNNQRLLSSDMEAVLIRQASFSQSREFEAFQYTADTLYLGVKYIVGVAAFISGDAELGERLHKTLEDELNRFNPLPVFLLPVKRRLPQLLSDEAYIIAKSKFLIGDNDSAKTNLAESLARNPENYSAMIMQSIVAFSVDNDPYKALSILKGALKYRGNDRTVFYNLAFLQFWTEDYRAALRSCEAVLKTDKSDVNDLVAKESEEFNLKLIEEGKFKDQLYFWLGILNFREQRNYPQALRYFENFLELATEQMDLLKEKAEQYLDIIKAKIGF